MKQNQDRLQYLILNLGHFFDHMFILIFATAAAIVLYQDWNMTYAQLLPYATPGLIAFGLFSYPAAWLADRWGKDRMICVFFIGTGISAIFTGFTQSPLQISIGLFFVGAFAAIYHPVALALITTKWSNIATKLAINGLWGNLGVAGTALITGLLIDAISWRVAYILPGVISIVLGVIYLLVCSKHIDDTNEPISNIKETINNEGFSKETKGNLFSTSVILTLVITTIASMMFQSASFMLPKIVEEQFVDQATALSQFIGNDNSEFFATSIGGITFIIFLIASLSQLLIAKFIDKHNPKHMLATTALAQCISIALLPNLTSFIGFLIITIFIIATFSQVIINDYLLAKVSSSQYRAQMYGLRYLLTFIAAALTMPSISYVYGTWGLHQVFYILAYLALGIAITACLLPTRINVEEKYCHST